MNIANIVFSGKWYILFTVLFISLGVQLYKFFSYKELSQFINNIKKFDGDYTTELIILMVKIIGSHIITSICREYIKNEISKKIHHIFDDLIIRMLSFKASFIKDIPKNEIYELWHYLSNYESLISSIIMDVPHSLIYLIYYSYTIYNFSVKTILIVVAINLGVLLITNPIINKQLEYSEKKNLFDLKTKKRFMEIVTNFLPIKVDNQQNREIDRVMESNKEFRKNAFWNRRIEIYKNLLIHSINDIIMFSIYIVGISYVLSKEMTPLDLMYIAVHTGNFYERLFGLKRTYDSYCKLKPKLKIIDKIVNYDKKEDIDIGDSLDIVKGENLVIFNKIFFSYQQDEKEKTIFEKFSAEIKYEKLNALLGRNGSGKSTLIKLLLRFYEIEKGEIIFGGRNIQETSLHSLRSDINFIFQDPYFFNETVEYNLKYGVDNCDNLDEVLETLNIKEWYDKYNDKIIENGGTNLSGGEKKKLQLANSLLKPSKLYIFDEPSNNLDIPTVQWLISIFSNKDIWKDKTILIISHDQRLIDICEHTINLEN